MIGERLGNYRVVRELGRGGMGVVYLAEHVLIARPAAIKVLRAELSRHQGAVHRLFNEARAVSRVRHPGIVELFDFGVHAGRAYVVMELLDGETLGRRLGRDRRLAVDVAVAIAGHIALVLAAAHAGGVIHRDLKPDNVYLVPDPERPGRDRVKLLDFGIAKLVDGASAATLSGSVMGTPAYMSPEQCHGARGVDHRTDIYSLGCVLFELIAGRRPFVGTGSGELLGAHQYVDPPALADLCPEVPAGLAATVAALLAKRREDRPQTMVEVVRLLEPFTDVAWLSLGLPSPPRRRGAAPPAPPVGELAPTRTIATRSGITTVDAVPSQAQARPAVPVSRRRRLAGLAATIGATAAIAAAVLVPRGDATADATPAPVAVPVTPTPTPPPPSSSPEQPDVPAPAVDLVVTLRLSPPTARVTLDGVVTTANPLRLSRDGGSHRLVVSAPGFATATRTLDATTAPTLTIHLARRDRAPVASPPPAPGPAAVRAPDNADAADAPTPHTTRREDLPFVESL